MRSLSAPFRYLLYFWGVLIVFALSVGIGIAAATVIDWQSSVASTSGPVETSTLQGGMLETTGVTRTPEETSSEPPIDEGNTGEGSGETTFVHRATDGNSRGDYTVIDDPNINGDPNAIVLASPTSDDQDNGSTSYGHNIGVWYAPNVQKWAIFNQDRSAVPEGASFRVSVPQPSVGFVHRATPDDTVGNATFLYGPDTNGKPDATVNVTQNWNPGGGEGIYNDHPVGVFYDDDVDQWAIINRDDAPIPKGAAFNVIVPGADGPKR